MAALLAFLAARRKTWAALFAVLLAWALVAYFPDGTVSRGEWASLLVGLSGVLGVHSISNEPLTDTSGTDVVAPYQPLFPEPDTPPDVPLAADPVTSIAVPPAPPLTVPVAA